jgi:hypothetical protein
MASVTVNGEDVTGVLLAPVPILTASGRLVVDAAGGRMLQPSNVRVIATPKGPDGLYFPVGEPPRVKDDFTFEIRSGPGRMLVRPSPLPPDWILKSVRLRGADVTDTGIDFGTGEAIDDLEVEVTNRLQVVSGIVTNAKNEPVTEAVVFLFPRDRRRWFVAPRFAAVGRPDQNGRYSLRTLPPDDYYGVALEYLDNDRRGGDPAYLEELSEDAVSFTLGEGEAKALDLRLR